MLDHEPRSPLPLSSNSRTEAIRLGTINRMEMQNQDTIPVSAGQIHGEMHGGIAQDEDELNKRTVRKLDFFLLPFLALLFLFNSLDRSNIGNAESANFTKDLGLAPEDVNTSVAVFFCFFVALQPFGAVLGRKFGMKIWIPSCMSLWGLATCAIVLVRTRWQLIMLRALIGILEAGFYPTTVAYMSLFYTRYEFGRRLSLFYGQYAVAGAFGGLLAFGVFSRFPSHDDEDSTGWKSWQILFLLEGGVTMLLAILGFFWLPHNARTAWFLRQDERLWAETRIRMDLEGPDMGRSKNDANQEEGEEDTEEEGQGLLSGAHATSCSSSNKLVTDARGLTTQDIAEAAADWKLWYLLICNVLSAVPATAFSVFLPLVLKSMTTTPAYANLLLVPPYVVGAAVLYAFSHWSDKTRERIVPILWSLGLLISGLTIVVLVPTSLAGPRYFALCGLLGGTFVASPLTIAWFAGNLPETGKRSVVLGVNGWGNIAGVIASIIFQPKYGPYYTLPFFVTLGLVGISFVGYAVFRRLLIHANASRIVILRNWTDSEIEDERLHGQGPIQKKKPIILTYLGRVIGKERVKWMEDAFADERRGDERITFTYSL